MNTISKTAYFCCGVRMKDANSTNPICNDIYAVEFMNEEGNQVFNKFKNLRSTIIISSVRARIIEDELRKRIKRNKDLQIVNIGAGFDTRPYRIAGGTWIEIDEPQIIMLKNKQLPVERCANKLARIAVEFKNGELKAALKQCDLKKETVIVIEGVFMYLEKNQIIDLLELLKSKFSRHTLLCDLFDEVYFNRYLKKIHRSFLELGSQFKLMEKSPCDIFTSQGYYTNAHISIPKRSIELKKLYIPSFVLNTFLKSLKNGYRIYIFNHGIAGEVND